MRVDVRLMGVLRDAAGSPEVRLEVEEGSSLGDVVDRLIEERPELEDVLIDRVVDSYAPNALIIVDGVEASNLEGSSTSLRDGSTLVFLPVTHGG
ncbi:MAG TPA: MoaD/ThiS family protein [Candidatus Krumholzibacteriaceae bacterium]|nr:MoaD/ThiS family protein [Candidatus Krumholzibacteriaceae bacterium]